MKNSVLFAFLMTAGVLAGVPACTRDKATSGTVSVLASTSGSSAGTTTPAIAPDSSPTPKSINDVGTYGEDLYDELKTGRPKRTKDLLDSLREAAKELPRDDRLKPQRASVERAITALGKAMTTRNHAAALEAANQATLASAQMTASFSGPIPSGVLVLEYYGRELEIRSAKKDVAGLKRTAAALTTSWTTLKPTVEAKGGGTAAARADSLIAQINTAKSLSDYGKITPAFLDQVDVLEKVFTNQ
jgi:hypothetical protein